MDIRSLSATGAGPQGLDALAATAAPQAAEPAPRTLDPPVKLDIGAGADDTRYVRDADTNALVFQVVEPTSGDVIEQLPSETALRNRAYDTARAQSAAQGAAGSLSKVA